MRNEFDELEYVKGVDFDFIDSFKNNGIENLLIFDNSCEKTSNSKALFGIATAKRHLALSTLVTKHNLLYQRRLGWYFELQVTHIVPFKSPWDVMQVSRLSAVLGVGSELVDWYETQRLYLWVICCFTCRKEQMTDYVTAQSLDSLFQNFPECLEHLK